MNKPSSISPRTRFAELLRAYYLGRITNWDFEEAVESLEGSEEEENLIFTVFYGGPWFSYSDNREYKFTAEGKLTRENRKIVARWILFLKSNQPYRWPSPKPLSVWIGLPLLVSGLPLAYIVGSLYCLPAGLLPFLIAAIINRRLQRKAHLALPVDPQYWPFLDREHLEEALCNPPYLRGAAHPAT